MRKCIFHYVGLTGLKIISMLEDKLRKSLSIGHLALSH